METDSACSYIHLEVIKSSLKDLYNTKVQRKILLLDKESTKFKDKRSYVKERELRACLSQYSKMYEHVGMGEPPPQTQK